MTITQLDTCRNCGARIFIYEITQDKVIVWSHWETNHSPCAGAMPTKKWIVTYRVVGRKKTLQAIPLGERKKA